MRLFALIAIITFLYQESSAQKKDTIPEEPILWCGPIIRDAYNQGWTKYLEENLVLDSLTTDTIPAGAYSASVQFIINTDGVISNVKIKTNPGYHLGEKLKSVVMAYPYKWIPAEQNGRKVKSYRVQRVIFIIEEECGSGVSPGITL